MTSYELIEGLKGVVDIFKKDELFYDVLSSLSIVYDKYISQVTRAVNIGSPQDALNMVNQAKSEFNSSPGIVNKITLKQFYGHVDSIEENLKNINLVDSDGIDISKTLIELVDEYQKIYESYARNNNNSLAAFNLAKSAKNLVIQLNQIETAYGVIKGNLGYSVDTTSGSMLLMLSAKYSYSEFNAKLFTLENIYEELCGLCNVNINDEPLQIVRIESGSLLANIRGNAVVVHLMIELISSAFNYTYNRFSETGKVEQLSKKVELLDKMIDMSAKLKESGVDTTGMDDNLNKAAVVISSELNKMIIGETVVIINGKKFAIASNLKKKYLSHSKKLLIPHDTVKSEMETELLDNQ